MQQWSDRSGTKFPGNLTPAEFAIRDAGVSRVGRPQLGKFPVCKSSLDRLGLWNVGILFDVDRHFAP